MATLNQLISAGFTSDEIKAEAAHQRDNLLGAGFTLDEVNSYLKDEYGLDWSYNDNDEDTFTNITDLMSVNPEEAEKASIVNDVSALQQRQDLAKEAVAPTSAAQGQAPTNTGRNYTDEELKDTTLWGLRDSVMLDKPLTHSDKALQASFYRQGEIAPPEYPKTERWEVGEPRSPNWEWMRDATSGTDALMAGFQHSVSGLTYRGALPNIRLQDNATIPEKVLMSAGSMIGDLPTFITGAAAGGGATLETGPFAVGFAFAGGSALTESVKTALMLEYSRGRATSFGEWMGRVGEVGKAGAKAGAVGFVSGYAGGLAGQSAKFVNPAFLQPAARPAVEVATMTTLGAAMEGQVPTLDDFIVAGATVGGMRLAGFYTNKLQYTYGRTGADPKSLIQYAAEDPSIREDIASVNNLNPRALGGNNRPVYTLGTKELTELSGTDNNWLYFSRQIAGRVSEGINKRNGVTDATALDAYKVSEFSIPGDTNLLWIRSASDPNMVRLYKQFFKSRNPDETFSGQSARDLTTMARKLFQDPTPEFKQFLETGLGKLGPKEDQPLTSIQGIRYQDRVLLFDQKMAQAGNMLQQGNRSFDFAVKDIESSISVNEYTTPSWKEWSLNTYQSLVDKFQPLNSVAPTGEVTVPYLSARLFMGIDGLARHWVYNGRTEFVRPSVSEAKGQSRPVSGVPLRDILRQGSNQMREISPEIKQAMDDVNLRLNENTAKGNEVLLAEARGLNASNPELMSKDTLNRLTAEVTESTRALQTSDPLSMFRTYVVARHAQDLAARGIETGLNIESINAVANNKSLQARFESAANELYEYQRDLLKYQRDSGLISNKTYNNAVTQNPRYIPMNRVIEGEATMSTGTYAIKGSARDIIDPFESIIRQTFYTLQAAERNSTRRLIAEQFGTPVTQQGSKTTTVGSVTELANLEANARGANQATTMEYRIGGRSRRVSVPVEIARTANLLDPVSTQVFNGLTSVAARGASVLRAGAIFHPEFGARNIIRDQFSAYINSPSGYKAFWDMGKGLGAITTYHTEGATSFSGKLANAAARKLFPHAEGQYAEWLRSGGSNANLVSMDRRYSQEMQRTLLNTNNVQNSIPATTQALNYLQTILNPINWVKGAYRGLQQFSELSEEATRLGEFVRARESGASPMEAAYRSREVTMDFARIGASMKSVNAISVFFNAKVQGADRSIRQFASNPGVTAERVFASIVVPSIMLAMVRNDYKYNAPNSYIAQALNEVPDWQKQTFWIVPSEMGIFRIPKPHEFGVPFANPMESFIDHIYDTSDDKSYLHKLYSEGFLGQIAEQFMLDPLTLGTSLMPTILLPPAEVAANWKFHTSTPIIPPTMENQLPETRYNRNTTELSKTLGRLLSNIDPLLDSNFTQRLISPPSIDHLVQGYGGTLGKDMWNLLDTALQKSGVLEEIKKPAMALEDMPIIKAFMTKYPTAGNKSIDEFFSKADRYEQTLASAKALFREGRESSIARAERILMEENYGRFTNIRQTISQISNQIRMIHFNPDIAPEEKRYLMDCMYLQMIELSQGGLTIMTNIERANRMMRNGELGNVD